MGRSRGGLTTKVHALVDADGLPVALKLSEGQAHDGPAAADMFDTVGAWAHPACGSRLRFERLARHAQQTRCMG